MATRRPPFAARYSGAARRSGSGGDYYNPALRPKYNLSRHPGLEQGRRQRRSKPAGIRDILPGMDRNAIIATLREKAPELQARGVTHLAIYGSRARGDARPESDLDVLLEVDEGRKFSLIDLVGVERRIREAVGFATFAVMRRSLKPDFAKRIAPDVIEVF